MNALWECHPGDGCLWLAAEVLLQVTVVILAAWMLAHTVARRRAAARHGIWLCALVFVLLSPVTANLTDRAGVVTFVVHLPAGSPPEAAPPIAANPAPASLFADEPPLDGHLPPNASTKTGEPLPQNEVRAEDRSAVATAAAPVSGVVWLRASAVTALAIWAVGAFYLLARLLWRGQALRGLVREACPVEDLPLQGVLDRIRRSLGVKRLPRVLAWRGAEMRITPVTAGVLRPVIVLSTDLLHTLREDELRDVLVHECAHVLRRDPLVGLVQRIAGIGFWPYPPVRLMNRELTRAREEVCDNYVLRFSDGAQYARTLFDLAQTVAPLAPRLAQLGLLQPCWRLEDRVAGLLDPRRNTMTRLNRFIALTLAAAFLAIALLTAGAKFVRAEPRPADPAVVAAAEKPVPPPQLADAMAALPQKPDVAALPPIPPEGLRYTGRVTEKGTGKPIAGATVTVRRLSPGGKVLEEPKYQTNAEGKYTFTIPPEQAAMRSLYIELDVSHPDYAEERGFGYGLSLIRKDETLGERPFFERVELIPAEPISGTAVMPDGRPAAGIKVRGYFSMGAPGFQGDKSSFTETKTDDKGAFRLNLAKGGDGIFWLLPGDLAPSTHVVHEKRGDMGRFTLQKGIVVKGRVVDRHGKPLAGLLVHAVVSGGPANKEDEFPSCCYGLGRDALTDQKGEFTLAPLPASEYLIHVAINTYDSLNGHYTPPVPPAAFAPQLLLLKEGETEKSVELAAVPEVVIEGHYYDTRGKPTSGNAPVLQGQMPGTDSSSPIGFYQTDGTMNANGKFVIRAPKGLQEAILSFYTSAHGVVRVRMKKDGPQSNRRSVELGILEHDIREIEVVRYDAPILFVRSVLEGGTPAKGIEMEMSYTKGRSPTESPEEGDSVSFSRQPDGRFCTHQLLPDEEFTVTVRAEGCKSKSQTLKLAEGAVRELEFKLQKGQDPEKAY
jgi:beta-lactamase regulating signal transducer with metallopeptidase domain